MSSTQSPAMLAVSSWPTPALPRWRPGLIARRPMTEFLVLTFTLAYQRRRQHSGRCTTTRRAHRLNRARRARSFPALPEQSTHEQGQLDRLR